MERLKAFLVEALQRAAARVAASPELLAAFGGAEDSDLIALLLVAVQRSIQEAFHERSWDDLLGPNREQMIDACVATAVDTVT